MVDFFMTNAQEILHTTLEEAKALLIIYYCQRKCLFTPSRGVQED